MHGQLKLFTGSAHPALAREIAEHLNLSLGAARLHRFPDSEVSFQIDENIRGTDVFIVQPTCAPVDEHIMELLIMVDAFRRSSSARITAVIPYYGYARQDRKDKPRVPISAKLVANVLSASGVDRVLTMDLHKAQIQGFFDIPVDHLFAAPVIIDYLARQDFPKLTIVAPDAGGAERAVVHHIRHQQAMGLPAGDLAGAAADAAGGIHQHTDELLGMAQLERRQLTRRQGRRAGGQCRFQKVPSVHSRFLIPAVIDPTPRSRGLPMARDPGGRSRNPRSRPPRYPTGDTSSNSCERRPWR